MRTPTTAIISTLKKKPGQFLFKTLFSTSSSALPLDPDRPDLPSQLFSILSKNPQKWKKHPSMKKLIPFISASHVSSLYKLNLNPQVALDFSFWISRKPGFKHSVESYFSLVNLLIGSNFVEAGEKIASFMFKSCHSAEDVGVALDFVRKINDGDGESKFKLRVKGYNTLLMLLAKFCLVDEMKWVYSVMLKNTIVPDIYTFNAMVNGYCKVGNVLEAELAGHFDTAYRVIGLMKECGLVPNQWTYSVFIDTLCKRGSLEEAHIMFESLKEKGIKANEVIYTALIDGYCKAGKIENAHSLLERMLIDDCFPNSYTFNSLIHGLCKEKKVKEALSLEEKMVKMGVHPTVRTYTILIEGLLKDGDFDHAHRLLDQMVSSGYKPDVFTYTAFIQAYCSTGKLNEAEDLMVKMDGEGIVPDSVTYTLLIRAYANLGLVYSAFDVLKRMFDAGCEPSYHTYAFLISHLSKKKWMKENSDVMGLYLVSNVTFVEAADVWKMMEFDTAVELFETMLEHGCAPNVNTFGKLIIGLCKVERLAVAQRLFDYMRERGISPNEDIYNSLLKCCCGLGMYEEAVRLVDAMIEHGHLPHLESYKLLLCGLYDERNIEKAKVVFHNLLDCGYNNDEVAWKIFIEGLLKKGFGDGCSELLSIMEEKGCQEKAFACPFLWMVWLIAHGSAPDHFGTQSL
ncbi:hypothetical protein Patl1_23434 [Pistacia atlantica]|uniref:Uncharacterized protein n=1 Tax=Pistacia atlantica TaxID=434234 RepID=A0ACC1A0R1_9ROSI|nr:hypothetical protein Patl1_23434 [Pistacia atlantica]